MNQNKPISVKQAICIITLYIFGSSAIIGGSSVLGQDSWIAILTATLIALPLVIMYARIMRLYPEKDIFDIIFILFGKIIGRVFIALMSLYAVVLTSLVMRNYSEFYQITSMPETPQYAFLIMIVIVLVIMAFSGIQALGKWSVIVLPIMFFIIFLTIVLALKQMNFTNILPVMNHKVSDIAFSAYGLFTFPFAETVLFLALTSSVKKESNPYKIYILGVLFGSLILLVISFRNLFILGSVMVESSYFPSYIAIKIVRLGDFLSRLEASMASNFFLSGITKASVCLIFASKGFAKLFNIKNYKKTVIPIGIINVFISVFIYKSTMEMFNALPVYAVISPVFQILIPVIVWIVAEIKVHKDKNKDKENRPKKPLVPDSVLQE